LSSFYFDRFLTPNGPFIYYTNSSDVINEYSVETGTITNVITTSSGWFYTFAVSPNGKYLLAATGTSDFSYLFYDLKTNQSAWVPSNQVIGAGAETGIISVADNGLASIITANKFVVYDFLHLGFVTQQALPVDGDRTVISADGQYIFAEAGNLYLYKLVSGALQQKWSSSGSSGIVKYYTFDPSQPAKAKIFIDQTFYTKNCETWATEGSFAMDIDNIRNIDFTNGHILGNTATYFKVFDPNTGSLQFQNPTSQNLVTFDLRIKKNTVYHYGGKKLIIF
jgi:WD40 repeat protein